MNRRKSAEKNAKIGLKIEQNDLSIEREIVTNLIVERKSHNSKQLKNNTSEEM